MKKILAVVGLVGLFYLGLWLAGVNLIRVAREVLPAWLLDFYEFPNLLLFLAVSLTPLLAASVIYRGRRRDHILLAAAVGFTAFMWIPWLGPAFVSPASIPAEKFVKMASDYGYRVCGVYTADPNGEQVYVYEETLTTARKCFFLLLRPEPRYKHMLSLNVTFEVRPNRHAYYSFHTGNFLATQLYYGPRDIFLAEKNASLRVDYYKEISRSVADDYTIWFVFKPWAEGRPGPGPEEVKVSITVRLVGVPLK